MECIARERRKVIEEKVRKYKIWMISDGKESTNLVSWNKIRLLTQPRMCTPLWDLEDMFRKDIGEDLETNCEYGDIEIMFFRRAGEERNGIESKWIERK